MAAFLVACGGDDEPPAAAPPSAEVTAEAGAGEGASPTSVETTQPVDEPTAPSTVPVCDLVPVEEIAALSGRPVDAAEDRTIGFRGECGYTAQGTLEITVGAQFYGPANIDFGFEDNLDAEEVSTLDGVGDRASVRDATAEFELVVQSGGYIVLVGVRGEQRDQLPADGLRSLGVRVLELLAPAMS